ncbi:MAG TPA: adenylate/guanylate cyclase domain-containing protein [Propylenella sp.]|nr:adenylate/guanylate cyclase domain-containing protein [Propylenella sp.]
MRESKPFTFPPELVPGADPPQAPLLERKLAAILAADVEGYSRLMHADEERALAVLTSHRQIVDNLIEAAHGQIFGTAGDSVLAEFASIVDAFHCAIAIQQALAQANAALPEEDRMYLRIGINVGDVMLKNGDVFGDGVNVAARVQAMAEPGGICVTRAVRDHLRDRIDAKFQDLGEHSVKNIARPVRVFRAIFDPDAEPTVPLQWTSPPDAGQTHEPPVDPVELAFWQSVQASNDDNEYRIYLERYPHGTFVDLARARLETVTPSATADTDETNVELVFWQSVQASNDDAEYRIYLQRYPNGAFADLARARLDNGRGAHTETGVELAFWETVRDSGDPKMVRAYLQKYPNGEFRSLAEILLDKLEQRPSDGTLNS